MYKPVDARAARYRRHRRIRVRLSGTGNRPRLSVFRSLQHMYAQLIDDASGRTIAAASTVDAALKLPQAGASTKSEQARAVGKAIAERAKERGVEAVVFDRGGYQYHGRVKALADGAREAGLEF